MPSSIFSRRPSIFPYEHAECLEYVKAIRDSYWTPDHFKFHLDQADFRLLDPVSRTVCERSILAISHVESKAVKTFWGDLHLIMPNYEFASVGYCFAESECRHAETYAELLRVMQLQHLFDTIDTVPAIRARIAYLEQSMVGARSGQTREYALTLALFSLFIENVSLFGQFAIMKSFSKHTGTLRIIDNAVQATQKEEVVHAQFGIYLIKKIREERPDWFDADFYDRLRQMCIASRAAERSILSWIFEKGEPECVKQVTVEAFLDDRFNQSLGELGCDPLFTVREEALKPLFWMVEEIHCQASTDFFSGTPVGYSRVQVNADSMFS